MKELQDQLESARSSAAESQAKALQEANSLKEQLAKERAANRKNTESVAKVSSLIVNSKSLAPCSPWQQVCFYFSQMGVQLAPPSWWLAVLDAILEADYGCVCFAEDGGDQWQSAQG